MIRAKRVFSFRSAAVAILICQEAARALPVNGGKTKVPRHLSFGSLATYEPQTDVSDHAAIDLDQRSILTALGLRTEESFADARAVYESGGHSKSYAVVNVPAGLNKKLDKGTEITGKATNEVATVVGKAYDTFEAGSKTISIQYKNDDCRVGALPLVGEDNTNGCLLVSGKINIENDAEYDYNYIVDEGNLNGRTIAGFSKEAEKKMYNDCPGCPYKDFKEFYDYYGEYDYAHQWVTAALDGSPTPFKNGNADFGRYGMVGRQEAAQKGTAYMNVFMYVIREFEDALDDCKDGCIKCNDDPVHAWDEGVAFYTGSLEGSDGSGEGTLLYSLADKRCENFKTCGTKGNSLEGTSKINYDLFSLFALGQHNLLAGNCDAARKNKERIAELMAVPLVQGTLRYAYKVDKLQGEEKEKAEGAVFAAAVLPKVHKCNSGAANAIYNNMRVGASSTSASAVKTAFESVYGCLKISCADVGGLWDTGEDTFYGGYGPCEDPEEDISVQESEAGESVNVVAVVLGSLAAAIAVAAFICIFYMRRREKQGDPMFSPSETKEIA